MLEVQVYLGFTGNCEEAIHFYQKVFNGTNITILRYKDILGSDSYEKEQSEWVMHGEMTIDKSVFIFNDHSDNTSLTGGMSIAMKYDSIEEVKRVYQEIKEGADILLDLQATFFSPLYTSLVDKYGVHWIIMLNQ